MNYPEAILKIFELLDAHIMIISIGWFISRVVSAWKFGNLLKR